MVGKTPVNLADAAGDDDKCGCRIHAAANGVPVVATDIAADFIGRRARPVFGSDHRRDSFAACIP